jgi:hypothetical protein
MLSGLREWSCHVSVIGAMTMSEAMSGAVIVTCLPAQTRSTTTYILAEENAVRHEGCGSGVHHGTVTLVPGS